MPRSKLSKAEMIERHIGRGQSLGEIAQIAGVSRERVRQVVTDGRRGAGFEPGERASARIMARRRRQMLEAYEADETVTITDLARMFATTEVTARRALREMGVGTLRQRERARLYRQRARCERAIELLSHGILAEREVAGALGYGSVAKMRDMIEQEEARHPERYRASTPSDLA